MKRSFVISMALFALASLGNKCEGDGSGGGAPILAISPLDARCTPLLGDFPPGFDFMPDDPATVGAVLFFPASVIFLDLDFDPPRPIAEGDVVPVPPDSDGDGILDEDRRLCAADPFSRSPALGVPLGVRDDLLFVSSSNYEQVLFFEPPNGDLAVHWVANPNDTPSGSYFAEDYPWLPAAGTQALRTAVSTKACIYLPSGTLDSNGDLISQETCCTRDPDAASFTTRFTAGMARSSDRLFVATSNLRRTSTAQFMPGTVLVYEVDWSADPLIIQPDTETPYLVTTGFNPTALTRHTNSSGRELILVTVTGAIGAGVGSDNVKTDGFIDVIDAASRRRVATIPLGRSGPSFHRLGIDGQARVAFFGASSERNLYAIDLAPLDDESLYAESDAIVLDGSDPVFPDARIFTADTPFVIPARAAGPPPQQCAGFTSAAASASGKSVLVTDFCDGTLTIIDIDIPSARCNGSEPPGTCCDAVPLPGDCFVLQRQENVLAPITEFRELNAPGALASRPGEPGIDYTGPDVYFIAGQSEGQLCGIRVESF